jgi:ubiquinol-cytochrome c reductase cytochrome b/c1 subunit
MLGSIFIPFFLPWVDTSPVRSARFRPVFRVYFWIFLVDCVLLTFVGGRPPEGTLLTVGPFGTAYYFINFFVILPLIGRFERPLPLLASLGQRATVLEHPGAP